MPCLHASLQSLQYAQGNEDKMTIEEISQAISEGTIEKQWMGPAWWDKEDGTNEIIQDYWYYYEIQTSLGKMRLRVPNQSPTSAVKSEDWLKNNLSYLNAPIVKETK